MLQRIVGGAPNLSLPERATATATAIAAAGDLAAGSVIHLPHGDVAADFRATGTVRNDRKATYELVVANDTAATLATFAYARAVPGSGRVTWNAVIVPPYSAIAIEIAVTIPRRGRMPRVVADVFADDAHVTLDAPPFRSAGGSARRVALAGCAAVLLALGAATFAQSRPRVVALAAPEAVRGGAPFSVAYAFSGDGAGSYVVETPDGTRVDAGTLAGASGAFTLDLPKATVSSGYDVRVSAAGRFGGDERTAHVVALAAPTPAAIRTAPPKPKPPAPAPVALDALALEHDVVGAGDSIVVTYRPTKDPGIVRLIDSLGTVRAEALLTPRGRTILVAPHVDADQDFRIVATAQRGVAHAEGTLAVTIRNAPLPGASGAPGDALAAAVRAPKTNAPIAVDPDQVVRRPIVVRVDRYVRDLHVALMGGSSGEELAGVDVAPGDRSIALEPPVAPPAGRYAVVATYTSTLGAETVVRPIALAGK